MPRAAGYAAEDFSQLPGVISMKVITQLIRHFWQRGALSYDQAEYLLDQGFARMADLPGFKRRERVVVERQIEVLHPQPFEIATEEIQTPPRRRGGGGPKGSVPETEDLRPRLPRKQFVRRKRASPCRRSCDWRSDSSLAGIGRMRRS